MYDSSNSDGPSAVTTPGSQPSQTQTQNSRALAPRPSDGSSGVDSDLAHPGAAGTLSGSKKRVVQASRGVATMTPDRLARKRANDREAQRAVRERTKAQIRELQDEVSVLKNDQAHLQHILQENSALQAENTAMKQAMAQLVHQLDSQNIGQQSSMQHHQHHHEHHHHHHNHRGSHYRHRDQRISQEYSRSTTKSSTVTGESSDQSFHRDNSGESSSSSDPNCCSPGNSNLVLPSIEEMTRRPFPDASKGPGSSYSHDSSSKHESNMTHQRESFEQNSFKDHQPSFQPMDKHHHHRHQHRHQNQHQKPQQYGYSSSPSLSPPYYQALNQETSRFMLSTHINLEDLPNMSASVGDFGKPNVAMIEALENFYGNGNGRHADGNGNDSWNGNGKKYNNDGLNDTNMGNSENGSIDNRTVRKGNSLYNNSRHIKLPLLHASSTCEIDSFLLPLLSMSDQCQPTQIDIAVLLAPSIVSYNPQRVKLDPFSTALAEIMLLVEPPADERVPERVAVMYTAFLLIRYMMNATTENFGCVPEFLKPLEDQLERTHAVWIDFIPFPHARIKLIADSSREGGDNDGGNSNSNDGGNSNSNDDGVSIDSSNGNGDEGRTTSDDSSTARGAEPPRPFFLEYFACLSINWPYQDSDVLLAANGSDAGSRELMINPVFEAHIRKLENWSVSRDFLDTFPEFEHLINLQEN
ncbi:hypothetical protein Cpir12675_003485 [Ceratocystis pirilliformis]|uniref:BZIP domain-containing protein n=1 Tax=Ceratocystis pirilliformis TaxID=259994 RepID=A0ABR3Z473_9PEZI